MEGHLQCEREGKSQDFLFCHSDCERAILNAVTQSFPNVDIRVCHFHVADAIRRHCSSLGLTRLIRSNKNFQAFYERCRNISYFPFNLWPELWKKMKSSLSPSMQRHSGVAKFIEYMEATWIPVEFPFLPNAVLFNPSITCLFQGDDGIITNNFCESYNARLKLKFGNNPNFYQFLGMLRHELYVVEVEYHQRHLSSQRQSRERKERFAKRSDWEQTLQRRLEDGTPDGEALLSALDQMVLINKRNQATLSSHSVHENGLANGTPIEHAQPTSTALSNVVIATPSKPPTPLSMPLEMTETGVSSSLNQDTTSDSMEVSEEMLVGGSTGNERPHPSTQELQSTTSSNSQKSSSPNSTSEEEVSIEVRRQKNIEANRKFLIESGFIKDQNCHDFNQMKKNAQQMHEGIWCNQKRKSSGYSQNITFGKPTSKYQHGKISHKTTAATGCKKASSSTVVLLGMWEILCKKIQP